MDGRYGDTRLWELRWRPSWCGVGPVILVLCRATCGLLHDMRTGSSPNLRLALVLVLVLVLVWMLVLLSVLLCEPFG